MSVSFHRDLEVVLKGSFLRSDSLFSSDCHLTDNT